MHGYTEKLSVRIELPGEVFVYPKRIWPVTLGVGLKEGTMLVYDPPRNIPEHHNHMLEGIVPTYRHLGHFIQSLAVNHMSQVFTKPTHCS